MLFDWFLRSVVRRFWWVLLPFGGFICYRVCSQSGDRSGTILLD